MVGSALTAALTEAGHSVRRLVRREPRADQGEFAWDPMAGRIDPAALAGVDAIVHLAGENIAQGRWTTKKKQRIRDSRIQGTRLLTDALARSDRPPKVWICASGIGYYGDRGDAILTEQSPPGEDFVAKVCRQWESAAAPATSRGVRVVSLRFGVILHPSGGALARMLTPFRLGLGGPVGNGRQYMSWIALDDAIASIRFALNEASLKGPVNVVAPEPVIQHAFAKTLGRVLHRPAILPLPAFAARLAFGELADALLLSSARVEPRRLTKAGFKFTYPDLEQALRHLLKQT